ncbi:MAG: methionine ABC transporter ATP-binding protein [Clostridiaceae bacterium]|nr:methionine ABC transporter ATP-binding protein [Clostridiaceae bacterium]
MNKQDNIILKVENLSKVFAIKPEPIEALTDINLEIYAGEIFGIIGLSGAGKSTLIRCLNLLEKPTSGRVFFKGRDLSSLPKSELLELRQSMGMIFQSFNLFQQRSAIENICYPLEIAKVPREQRLARARELLELVGLPDRETATPSELSGGQQQRVAIARALATSPSVLLCDEATSALDPSTTDSILALLKQINRDLGVTIVLITHEMSVVERICDRVAVIDRSRIVEVGSVTDLFVHPQSAIARQLVFPGGELVERLTGDAALRIVFDGESSFEPVLANMVLACQAPVNILSADSKNIEGRAYGQMLIQLPDDPAAQRRIREYLNSRKITFTEEIWNDNA